MRIVFLFLFVFSSLTFAQKVFCYKKGVATNEVDPFMVLNGSECKGKYSVEYMEENGWKLKETQFVKKENKYDHFYFFEKKDENKIDINSFEPQSKVTKSFSFEQEELIINSVVNNTAKIDKKNLSIGQSGVIIHKNDMENIILSIAVVINSDNEGSIIKFIDKKIYDQDAIPDTNIKPSNGDVFILNHLYKSSLLIVPNNEAKQIIEEAYKEQLFIDEDYFAAYLKLEDESKPTKEMILKFCQENQLGTIFLVANGGLYIVDANTFSVLDKQQMILADPKEQLPFFSKIEPVKDSGDFFDLGINYNVFEEGYTLFKDEEEITYSKYYLKMLGKQ